MSHEYANECERKYENQNLGAEEMRREKKSITRCFAALWFFCFEIFTILTTNKSLFKLSLTRFLTIQIILTLQIALISITRTTNDR